MTGGTGGSGVSSGPSFLEIAPRLEKTPMIKRLVAVSFFLAACNGAPQADQDAQPEDLAPDQVAQTYAPELGVDLAGMERGPGGLLYEDLLVGEGELALAGRSVLVHYTGWLPDGTQFDSSHDRSEPFEVMLGAGRVIRGWDEGIPGMLEGGLRRLVIPHGMAYGSARMGPIPPRSTLVFDVELLEVR
jgi:FKBP-type peptidyl-prolyl cis-trans isomerase FkpA